MGLFDDKTKTSPSRGLANETGKENGALLGWLEGRIQADLKLAQALAANEAQRADYIKGLEERLSTKFQELQNQLKERDQALEGREAQLTDLKSEMQTLAQRVSQHSQALVGGEMQTTEQVKESVKTEIALLKSQLDEKQGLLQARDSATKELQESLNRKIHELQNQVKAEVLESHDTQLRDLKREMQAVVQRMVQAESAAQQAQTLAINETQLAEQVRGSFKAELTALQAQLTQKQAGLQASDSALKGLEESFTAKIQALQNQLKAEVLASHDAQIKDLKSEMNTLTERMAQLATAETLRAEQAAANVKAEMDALKTQLTLQAKDSIPKELEKSVNELLSQMNKPESAALDPATVERIARTESATQQLAQALAASEAQRAEQIKGLEERLNAKIQSLQTQPRPELLENHNAQLKDLKSEIETLVRRMVQAESAAQQAQTLAINETQLAEQIRGSFKAELTALQAQLTQKQAGLQASDSALKGLEESFTAKIQELQNQVRNSSGLPGSHDAELKNLKSEMNTLTERITQLAAIQALRAEQAAANVKAEMDALKTQLTLQAKDSIPKELEKSVNELLSQMNKPESAALDPATVERMARTESATQQLAQALAASEAQRAEQIRALEDAVNSNFRELRNRLKERDQTLEGREAQLVEFKSELRDLAQRVTQHSQALTGGESQRTEQINESIQREIATLKAQLNEKPGLLQATDAGLKGLEESFTAKIQELQNQLRNSSGLPGSHDAELKNLKSEMNTLTERMAQLATAETLRAEQFARNVKAEMDALKTQLTLQAKDSIPKELEKSVNELLSQMNKPESAALDPATVERMARTESATQQLAQALAASEAQRAEQIRALEDAVNSNFREMRNRLKEKDGGQDGRDQLNQALKSEMHALTERMTQLAATQALRAEQVAKGLEEEMAALKSQLTIQAKDSTMTELEQSLSELLSQVNKSHDRAVDPDTQEKIESLQALLAEQEKRFASRQASFKEVVETLTFRVHDLEHQLKLRDIAPEAATEAPATDQDPAPSDASSGTVVAYDTFSQRNKRGSVGG